MRWRGSNNTEPGAVATGSGYVQGSFLPQGDPVATAPRFRIIQPAKDIISLPKQMIKKTLKVLLLLVAIAIVALTIFWFARPADVSFAEHRATLHNAAYSRFAEIDGVRIHYQEKGNGVPLVLIHGYGSSTYSWKDVFEPLSQSFRVIAVDLKGFGFSSKPDGDYSRRAQAMLVLSLLESLQIEKAWLCGNSMGGEVALNAALLNPERVAGLILIDSGGVAVAGSGSLAPRYLLVPVVGRVLTALSLTSDKLVRQGLEKSFYDRTKITDERIANYYRPLQTRDGQRLRFARVPRQTSFRSKRNSAGSLFRR